MSDFIPINTGNAKSINEICSPVLKLVMLRYEALFDFYSEEPFAVNVQIKEGDNKYKLEQVMRIRRWGNNTKSYSWSIYSQQREWNENSHLEFNNYLIVRQVIWDMKADIDRIRKCSPNTKQQLMFSWPSITAVNICIDSKEAIELIKKILEVDKLIDHGMLLQSNNNPIWEWKDMELKRLFDWGAIHTTWSPIKKNVQIETKIEEFEKYLNQIVSKNNYEIYSLDLDYSINPEVFKNSITGEE